MPSIDHSEFRRIVEEAKEKGLIRPMTADEIKEINRKIIEERPKKPVVAPPLPSRIRIRRGTELIQDGDEYYENQQWYPVTAEDINILVSESGYGFVRTKENK